MGLDIILLTGRGTASGDSSSQPLLKNFISGEVPREHNVSLKISDTRETSLVVHYYIDMKYMYRGENYFPLLAYSWIALIP